MHSFLPQLLKMQLIILLTYYWALDSVALRLSFLQFVMRFAIWYHLYNLKKVKNTHGGVLLLKSCRLKSATLLKVTLLHECFSRFLNCANGTKSRKASHIYVTGFNTIEIIIFEIMNMANYYSTD